MSKSRFRFSLRKKLLLVSAAVLVIPYMGFDYLRQMESYLRDSLESSLVDSAYVVAGALNNEYSLFNLHAMDKDNSLFIHELNNTVQLDGYTDDWISYLEWADSYRSSDTEDSIRLIASVDDNYLYLMIQVRDANLIYTSPESVNGINGDHLIMVFTDPRYQLDRYYFVPVAPGTLRPFRLESRFDDFGVESEVRRDVTNITAVWQETDNGYNIEMKIPEYVIGERLGFILRDVDDATHVSDFLSIATAGEQTFMQPNTVLRSSLEIQNIILVQGRPEGRRTWVLDQYGQVLASDGSLKRSFPENAFNILYTLLLPPAYDYFNDDLAGVSRLQGKEVIDALSGQTATRWRSSPDGKAVIVSAATPVWLDDSVAGAVVIEETTNTIQIMQRQVLANLFNKTLMLFVLVVLLLVLFAGRLSSRLIRLNDETNAAIDEYGKVKGEFKPSQTSDEIGELSRSFSDILGRLQRYHRYLEGMAGRLSHELKTPMAMARSSLLRVEQSHDVAEKRSAIAAADQSLVRLQNVVSRLSEAARLEQALQEAEKKTVVINDFLHECVNAYCSVYGSERFELALPEEEIQHEINRDLFYQMLDKFVGNAVDFSEPESAITLRLGRKDHVWEIAISNIGPVLPDDMQADLFNSMVSVREKNEHDGPHLGLGLFVARLVADYHKLSLSAHNLNDGRGVCMTIRCNTSQ